MQQLIDNIIRSWFDADPATWRWAEAVHVAGMLLVGLIVGGLAAMYAGMLSWYERRIAGRMQSRIGPNRNGPGGFFQWIADAVKLLLKEDLIPADADHKLFRLAPYLVFVGFLLTFVALPLSPRLIVADLNVGIFYVMAITALVVVGILMSGWASNSKWALFGGMRGAAQVVSYEIPTGLALLVPVLMAGTLSTQGLIEAQGGLQSGANWQQGGWPWNWAMFANPMAFVAFFLFLTASLAEGNRTPFDLPEGESELVAGYFTEYSGIRFAIFMLTEWGNVYVMSALATLLFLGGWQLPGVSLAEFASATGWWFWIFEIGAPLLFLFKVFVLTTVIVWLRWTLPRVRVDQMMALCWKYLVPISMALVVLTAANEWLMSAVSPAVLFGLHVAFFVAAGVVPLVLFIKQTFKNIRLVGDRVDLSNW